MQFDERNFLYRYYGDFLRRYKPEYFVFENVLGLLSAGNQKYFVEMRKLFGEIGYATNYKVLNADEYGVLQKRKRVILIGRRGADRFEFPLITPTNFGKATKEDLFYDLPELAPGGEYIKASYTQNSNDYLQRSEIRNGNSFVTQHLTRDHNDRDLEIYALAIQKWIQDRHRLKYDELPAYLQTHNNKSSFLDRYKVVDPFGPSHTVVAHIAKDGHYYIYPDVNQVRSLSVREAARIQSFPDNYFFEGGRTAAFKQIGNAVPVLMAKEIANSVKEMAC
jgi:DNA (cytosine-5)-methyltransferase 1